VVALNEDTFSQPGRHRPRMRTIQYAVTSRIMLSALEYWMPLSRGMTAMLSGEAL
jgi:hypothetical protein